MQWRGSFSGLLFTRWRGLAILILGSTGFALGSVTVAPPEASAASAPSTQDAAAALARGDAAHAAGDDATAVAQYEIAAGKGNAVAMRHMGSDYTFGKGVAQDYVQAMQWFQKAAAAGDATAMNNIGMLYHEGFGVAKDYTQTLDWFKKAADRGNADGMTNLGSMYALGNGVAKDSKQALDWFQKAAAAGNANAMGNLGGMYAQGDGVAKDERVAMEWYAKAAAGGNVQAMESLGSCYRYGWGVAPDPAEGVKWYKKAAEGGNGAAMGDLGKCYWAGAGVAKDPEQAVVWFKKGAALGDAGAMSNLGAAYAQGVGVAQDYPQAVEWLEKAAALQDAGGVRNLGMMYLHGSGVPQDAAKARALFEKAANLGDEDAKTALAVIGGANVPELKSIVPPVAATEPAHVLTFAFGEGVGRGDVICATVAIGAHEYVFFVDTGATNSCIDGALAAADREAFKAAAGTDTISTFSGTKVTTARCIAPKMFVGGTRLQDVNPYMVEMDLTAIREQAGRPIAGILGMDILQNYVVHLDFDQRKLELIEPDTFHPPTGRTETSIDGLEKRSPKLTINLAGESDVLATMDTGDIGAFGLSESMAGKVAGAKGRFAESFGADASGIGGGRTLLLEQKWTWAGVAYKHVWAAQAERNAIGLAALANYDVICDFPGRRAYLRPLRNTFEQTDGMMFIGVVFRDGRFVINAVADDISKAGALVGDEIVAVDGKPTKGLEMWQVQDLTSKADMRVISLRRGEKAIDVTLHE